MRHSRNCDWVFLTCLLLFLSCSGAVLGQSRTAPNVLFIAVDDLRPELGCYGSSHIHSPNIDKFAASGRLFEQAYCQQSVCNPSRTSLMTGMRPDSIGVTGNHSHFRSSHPGVVTLPQHFKEHGYHAAAIGKIYHGVFPEGASATEWDTMGDPVSWSVPAVRFGPRYYYTEEGVAAAKAVYRRVYDPMNAEPDGWTRKLVFGPATESPNVPDNRLYDGKVAEAAIDKLQELRDKDSPFFLAVGFIKPHSPYVAPKKYFDLYKDVATPRYLELPKGAPKFAGHQSGELRRYTDQPKRGVIGGDNQRRVRQAYYACVSYIDAQVGRVLDELDRSGLSDNTVVVLFGDHGYHLGEQGLWGKTTNYELDTRVPLIVRAPGMRAAGRSTASLVELVDLYPTLVELCGLPVIETLEGTSFAPILSDPAAVTKTAALSQYPRSGGIMGYSMRTPTHRLTQWFMQESGEVQATELYDYADGPVETRNIANRFPRLVDAMSQRLVSFARIDRVRDSSSQGEDASTQSTSFEQAKSGPFEVLKTQVGVWTPTKGKTIVDDKHAKSGAQCLQLTGGMETSVTLELQSDADTSGELTFWAERWTKRQPFVFRIEKSSGGGWKEIYDGEKLIRVGRGFLSQVRVPLGDASIRRLRFTVGSPPNTGVLIDDLRLVPALPQRIVSVTAVPLTLPALVGADSSPLLKLKVVTEGSLNPISLTQLHASLQYKPGDVESAQVFLGDTNRSFSNASPFGKQIAVGRLKDRDMELEAIDGRETLVEGENFVWIACKLSREANIDHMVGATCSQIAFSDGTSVALDCVAIQRMGMSLRRGGDDGVKRFRIPGLATTNKGTLIGVYDIRRRGGGDLPGDIDVGMSRSFDAGRTWEPMRVIMDMGDDPKWLYDGIGDPAVLVDKNTGTIWVAATWSHGNRSWRGSGPGLEPEETGQLLLVRSDDDGETWSKPINITKQVKRPEWCFILQGPGKGITMLDGTIVFAAQYQDPPNPTDEVAHRLPHSTIIYSKDHGKTWSVGSGAFEDTTESQVVEMEPGVLMLNCRYNRKNSRVVMTTRDMGKTWQKHATSERSLIEPGSCMASLIDVNQELGRESSGWLLFSNPDSTRGRHHITIKASPDRGLSWPKEHRLLLDEETGAGYSCMSMIDQQTVGILYEGSQAHMTFQRIPLSELIGHKTQGEKSVSKAKPNSLKLPPIFSDHMVLQAGTEIPVWGQAAANAKVTITLGDERLETRAGQLGDWQLRLRERKSNASPVTMTIESDGKIVRFADVLVGEVWVCGGQSNMEWTLAQSTNGPSELSQADHPNLRLLNLKGGARGSSGVYTSQHLKRLTPEAYCKGAWQVASSDSASGFSAVAWYFGRQLQEELGVPVGLICPAVGGTPTEAWIPTEALEADPELKGLVAGNWLDNDRLGAFCRLRGEENLLIAMQAGELIPGDKNGPNHSFKPGFMWKAGIEPLIPYAIRGAIWYQGESNAETPCRVQEHGKLFPLLVNRWRAAWHQGDFPFLFVQLPALNRIEWPWFREGQRRTLGRLNNVGMAVTIDTGHPSNVHPVLKKPVGMRLAQWALGTTYGASEHSTYSGPLLDLAVREEASIRVSFKHVGGGLQSTDDEPLRFFEVCGNDGFFHPATAEIAAENSVRVSSPQVPDPQHVRYAWIPYPDESVNLINSVGLPASPFSTESTAELLARHASGTGKAENKRPNILLIVSEDNGPELGCYGDPFARTPNLDGLAAKGIRFETAYVTQAVCSPSRSTIFTGLYPHQNGQIGLATHHFRMFRAFPTTYSIMKAAGYRTGLLGKTHVNPERVIEEYVDFRRIPSSNFGKKNLADYAKLSAEFINASNDPFFLTVNFPDAHWPVQDQVQGRPKRLLDRSQVGALPYVGFNNDRLLGHMTGFYNCMSRLDECVGELLQELDDSGKADNTMVIYMGDHGAQFARGKVYVTEGGLRIPFIVRWPGKAKKGYVSKQMVSTIDLLPTIVTAAQGLLPEGLPGLDLGPILSGDEKPLREYLFGERNTDAATLHYPQRSVRDSRYKLIRTLLAGRPDPATHKYLINGASNFRGSPTYDELKSASPKTQALYSDWLNPPEFQLFDLKEDPHEFVNLADEPKYASVKSRLTKRLTQWQRETNDRLAEHRLLAKLNAEVEFCLKNNLRVPKGGWKYIDYLSPAGR